MGALGIAFATGILVQRAALLASFINVNLVLAGLTSWQFDGRIIAIQLMLLAMGTAAGFYRLPALWRSDESLTAFA